MTTWNLFLFRATFVWPPREPPPPASIQGIFPSFPLQNKRKSSFLLLDPSIYDITEGCVDIVCKLPTSANFCFLGPRTVRRSRQVPSVILFPCVVADGIPLLLLLFPFPLPVPSNQRIFSGNVWRLPRIHHRFYFRERIPGYVLRGVKRSIKGRQETSCLTYKIWGNVLPGGFYTVSSYQRDDRQTTLTLPTISRSTQWPARGALF